MFNLRTDRFPGKCKHKETKLLSFHFAYDLMKEFLDESKYDYRDIIQYRMFLVDKSIVLPYHIPVLLEEEECTYCGKYLGWKNGISPEYYKTVMLVEILGHDANKIENFRKR